MFHIHIDQIKVFKGTVVNQALPSFQRGSHEITKTVPLKHSFWYFFSRLFLPIFIFTLL